MCQVVYASTGGRAVPADGYDTIAPDDRPELRGISIDAGQRRYDRLPEGGRHAPEGYAVVMPRQNRPASGYRSLAPDTDVPARPAVRRPGAGAGAYHTLHPETRARSGTLDADANRSDSGAVYGFAVPSQTAARPQYVTAAAARPQYVTAADQRRSRGPTVAYSSVDSRGGSAGLWPTMVGNGAVRPGNQVVESVYAESSAA